MVDIEKLAVKVEGHQDYRVLRRLKTFPLLSGDPKNYKHGVFADFETTGLNEDAEVIEMCLYPFAFNIEGDLLDIGDPLHAYNQPSKPITAEITELTGITNELVEGHVLPLDKINELLEPTQLIVAHHASFDRKHAERISKHFEKVCWGCSMEQVPWKVRSRKLENILSSFGLFYDAHSAVNDCFAGIRALAEPVDGKTALAHLLEASRVKTWHAWALQAPFNGRDGKPLGDTAFKPRGYHWNGGDDGRPKAWHKEVVDREAETEWLRSTIYGGKLLTPARFDEVNAFNRFSRRG